VALGALVAAPGRPAAAPAAPTPAPPPPAAEAEPRPFTLEAFTAAVQAADPQGAAANAEVARLRAAQAAARAARRPVLDWNVLAIGPVPELRNDPNRLDAVVPGTRLRNGEWGAWGVQGHVGANLTWPVFTFGKGAAADEAAARETAAGVHAPQASRARAARDAAEIFWGWQLARRALAGLDDADRQLAGARERIERLVGAGSTQTTRQDLAELDFLRAQLAVRRSELAAARDLALETGRSAAGLAPDAPFAFAPAPLELPPLQLGPAARYEEAAAARRPEVAAARETLRAREAQRLARERAIYPDLVVLGFADVNWTGATTPQTNPFAYDPWNRVWGGVGVGLRGTLDLGRAHAASAQAAAEVEKARAEAEAAVRAVRVEAARAHAALRAAVDRAARLRDEEAAARRWLAQAEAGFDAGLSEAEPVLLAAVAIARAGAERLAAVRDAQLAAADLALAVGEDPRNVGAAH
jgi:outer membrane protein TolC